jgi:hypothetical protein
VRKELLPQPDGRGLPAQARRGALRRLNRPFEDPAAFEGSDEETRKEFRKIRDQIESRILAWLRELDEPDA